MGYLFLAIALFGGCTKGYCGKMTSGYISESSDAMLANMLRMIICIVIGFFMALIQDGIYAFAVSKNVLAISALSGITSSVFVVTWLISVRKGAYMMMDVFLMLGIIVPLIGSNICFGEGITLFQCLGLGLLLIAVLIMCSYNSSLKGAMNITALILLIICGVSSGLTDFSQKLFIECKGNTSIAVFNFYTYVFSALVLGICYGSTRIRSKAIHKKSKLSLIWVYVVIMAVSLFVNSFFQTKAAGYLPSAQLYPLSKGAGLILSSLMSVILFKEQMTVKSVTGIILSFVSLLIINM